MQRRAVSPHDQIAERARRQRLDFRADARQQALTDPHSPGRFRVFGTVGNMPEFQKAFSCKADQPMVSANACRVW